MKSSSPAGAGFIGSHTADRLLQLGHEVVVLDALDTTGPPRWTAPLPEPRGQCYEGDVRNEDLLRNLLRRVDAVYHLAAYQDYLPDFARFSDVNVVSTALLFQIIVAERLELARVVVASSQAAMGEGLYRCPLDGEQLPGMRPEAALAASGVGYHHARSVADPLTMQATPDTLPTPRTRRHVQTRPGDGCRAPGKKVRGFPPPPCATALCRARASPSSTPTPAPAASSASTIARTAPDSVRGRRGNPGLRQYRRRRGHERPHLL